ncbi:hypothetical protein T439DRAFT_333944 [Meredithblackwellia eburnea MCA 4105]
MLFTRLAALFFFVLGIHAIGAVQPVALGKRAQVEGVGAQQSFEKHRRHHLANVEREGENGELAERAVIAVFQPPNLILQWTVATTQREKLDCRPPPPSLSLPGLRPNLARHSSYPSQSIPSLLRQYGLNEARCLSNAGKDCNRRLEEEQLGGVEDQKGSNLQRLDLGQGPSQPAV